MQVIHPSVQLSVEKRKREFVHYSKRFSNTLKEYFKDQNATQVSISANQLIFQTALLIRTIREKMRKAVTLNLSTDLQIAKSCASKLFERDCRRGQLGNRFKGIFASSYCSRY
ncbi:Cerebral cavernous malformation protein 3 [Dirofilaria immitis]|nr:Cerebral cavernous malformation protein 3 [Dirofilaria immitis]